LKSSLDLSTLESHLWEAANILRGPVDAADFKTYIFPLLFFKRISDVYDEERTQVEAEYGEGIDFAEFHRFQIPEGCYWRDVRAHTTNVGHALQNALRGIEQANPRTLYGIFGDAQWTNKERLSDALLCDLIEHFSRLPLTNAVAQADVLGQATACRLRAAPITPFSSTSSPASTPAPDAAPSSFPTGCCSARTSRTCGPG